MAETLGPGDLVGTPLPDLTLRRSDGAPFALRGSVRTRPLALFFLIHVSTPG